MTIIIVLMTPIEMFWGSDSCLKSLYRVYFSTWFLSRGSIGLLIIYLAQRFFQENFKSLTCIIDCAFRVINIKCPE